MAIKILILALVLIGAVVLVKEGLHALRRARAGDRS